MDSATTLLKQIQDNNNYHFPRKELEQLMANPEESIPALLELLTDVVNNFKVYHDNPAFIGHLYAFFLLAQFREKRALPLVVEFFSRHGDKAEEMCTDFVTENLPRVLASVCDDDLEPIKQLIENPKVNEWVRSASVSSLTVLMLHDMLSRDVVIAYLQELMTDKLVRRPNEVWHSVVVEALRVDPDALQTEIEQAFDDGLIEEFFMGRSELPRALSKRPETRLAELRRDSHYNSFITNTITEMQYWAAFQAPAKPRPIEPVRFATEKPKLSRNASCHCGSGKKYKKCCWPN